MTARLPRLWQPGNPQNRVFLPDFWIRPIESPKVGPEHLPKNVALFETDLRMTKHDVRQYLEKIYNLPVRDVRLEYKAGEVTWDLPKDKRHRRAIWKDEDRKMAQVFFKKGSVIEFPNLATSDQNDEKDLNRILKEQNKDPNNKNRNFFNKNRHGVGKFFGI